MCIYIAIINVCVFLISPVPIAEPLTFVLKRRLLNGTTGAVGDIQRHHAKQFINLQCFLEVAELVI